MKSENHYVNNKDLYNAYVKHLEDVKTAKEQGLPLPPMPPYIGECIVAIATNLAYRPNFINYTFKDDMIGDAIENCLQYYRNYSPEKSKNPFAYITQICKYAFIRRIMKERKQSQIRQSFMGQSQIFSDVIFTQQLDTRTYSNVNLARSQNEFARNRDYRALNDDTDDDRLDDVDELKKRGESAEDSTKEALNLIKVIAAVRKKVAKSTSANLEEFMQ